MNRSTYFAAAVVAALTLAACSSDTDVGTNSASQAGDTAESTGDASSDTGVAGPTIDMSAVETFTDLSQDHTEDSVDYDQSPAVGGAHSPEWQNCGVYDEPIDDENAVHSMEHGAVWLAYNPSLSADDVEVLRAFARGQSHIVVSPYLGLADTEAVVATAWGTQLRLDSVDDLRLAVFVATYQEGPQTPELGVTCGGAKGDPIE